MLLKGPSQELRKLLAPTIPEPSSVPNGNLQQEEVSSQAKMRRLGVKYNSKGKHGLARELGNPYVGELNHHPLLHHLCAWGWRGLGVRTQGTLTPRSTPAAMSCELPVHDR